MRIVLLSIILLFSTSLFAISLEDGLRIHLNNFIKKGLDKNPKNITLEYIELYFKTLQYKELLELSTNQVKNNIHNLTKAEIETEINSNKKSSLKKTYKMFYSIKNRQIIDENNYNKSKIELSNLLHVKIYDVKLPLIPKVATTQEKVLKIALKSQDINQTIDKIESTKEDVNTQWKKYINIKNSLAIAKKNKDKREIIKISYNYALEKYKLLATNNSFINLILKKSIYQPTHKFLIGEKEDNIMELFFVEKIKKNTIKKHHKPKRTFSCFYVKTDILNVRKRPSSKSKIIHRYNKGQVICAMQQNFAWIKTKHGWCSKDYLSKSKL